MARKLLRALRGGRIADPAWADWRIHHGSLYPPTGLRGYAPWELEQLAAVLRQAALFRSLYDQLNPRRQLTPPTVLRAVQATDELGASSESPTLRPTENSPLDIDETD